MAHALRSATDVIFHLPCSGVVRGLQEVVRMPVFLRQCRRRGTIKYKRTTMHIFVRVGEFRAMEGRIRADEADVRRALDERRGIVRRQQGGDRARIVRPPEGVSNRQAGPRQEPAFQIQYGHRPCLGNRAGDRRYAGEKIGEARDS